MKVWLLYLVKNKPILLHFIFLFLCFKKGDYYNLKNNNLSLNRFVNLGTFNFVKNEFKVSESLKNTLDTHYYLTLLLKKFIRVGFWAKPFLPVIPVQKLI
jgi:hypothetical protein